MIQAKKALIDWAESQIGFREGDNNWNKYADNPDLIKWYGWRPQNQPWCDIFVDSAFLSCFGLENAAKMTYQPVGRGTALCSASANFYKSYGAWYNSPEVGDQVFFYYDGGINHTGIVVDVSGGVVTTIEGNTSDMVAKRSYATGHTLIAGYGRPKWETVSDEQVAPTKPPSNPNVVLPTISKGDKGEYVKSAQLLLIGRQFSCGSWGADGDFGNATDIAVRNFQTYKELEVDGVIGKDTWNKLLGG